jgi:hypothetical protein
MDAMRRVAAIIEPGTIFGKLTVVGPGAPHVRKSGLAEATSQCLCKCGTLKDIQNGSLRNGTRVSCGCSFKNRGVANLPEYFIWKSMISRCHNPQDQSYFRYGGRGIVVHDKWKESFACFLADVGLRPSALHSIDRLDNDGNYEPGNVAWRTREEQQNNMRNNLLVEFRGEVQTLARWAFQLGMNYDTLFNRISRAKWPVERALTTPVKSRNPLHMHKEQ